MAKGIRVNQLAKELGVPSKAILEKCRSEGLGDKVPNHMSVLAIGLAETVREWFTGHEGGGTAVEIAAPVDVAVKRKAARRKTKPKKIAPPAEEDRGEAGPPEDLAAEAGQQEVQAPVQPQPAIEQVPPVVEPSPAPQLPAEQPAPPASTVEALPAPVAPAPPEQMTPPVAAQAPVTDVEAPAEQPAAAEQAQPAPKVPARSAQRPAPPQRKPVTPAPKLTAPEPARIQGPRLIREEKPEIVPAPRPRRPFGGQAGGAAAAFTPARPQAGRGVRIGDDDEDTAAKKKTAKGGRTLSSRRRGPDGRRGEAMEKLKEYTEADLLERRERLASATSYRSGFDSHLEKTRRGPGFRAATALQRGEPIQLEEPITVKSLSAAMGVKSNEIISKLMRQGVFANINQALDRETAEMIALDYGVELRIKEQATLEALLREELAARTAASENLAPRPPVVTILGHVDHGKTSLLDRIRNANVAAGEAGGITQHTAAWMVRLGDKRVTFIDTPGHQAFTSMRARGANMTDVVVLVVSAAEGVQPQTIESINHARAAEVPIVVALNKIDRADANPDMVLGQLAANGLNPVEWGGDTEVVRTSATTGQGIEDLIEILDYQSQLLELKADPTAPAQGTVIESYVDEGLGPVATVLVQDGALKVGDILLSGPGYGRIRSLFDDRRQNVQEAGPAMPVIVSGLDVLPAAGDRFYVLDDFERARAIAEERQNRLRQEQLAQRNRITADNILDTMKAAESKTINLIIKADVQGSAETLVKTVTDQNTEEVKVRVIHWGVGAITESDVQLAMATRTKPTDNRVAIIGFHVVPDDAARTLAEQNHIDVKVYRVIYEIFDDLKKSLSGMLEPEVREKLHGHTEIRQVIKVSRIGNVAGCLVTDGHIQRGSKLRLIRDGVVVAEDLTIDSLRRIKEDVREVKSGLECGIKIAGYDDIKVGDVLEAYVRETHERTL